MGIRIKIEYRREWKSYLKWPENEAKPNVLVRGTSSKE